MKRLFSFLILLSPVLFALSANAQVLKKAPEYRLTTKWKLVIHLGIASSQDTLQVNVARDTFAFGSACWKMESFSRSLQGAGRREAIVFLVRKSDANTIAWKYGENWEQLEFNVLQFPMKVGAVFEAGIKAVGSFESILPYGGKKILCKVSSRGDWEFAPVLSNGSKPGTWIVNCMLSPAFGSGYIFPVHFIEPDESAGFPGSCPLQVFYESFIGIVSSGGGSHEDGSIEIVGWEW